MLLSFTVNSGFNNSLLSRNVKIKMQGKAIPLQAWAGLEGSRKFGLPDFRTVGT